MQRTFAIARHANVVRVDGLDGRLDQVTDVRVLSPSPFTWTHDGRRPDYYRWSWNPATGDLAIGVVHRHKDHIAVTPVYPIAAWVRGFYFVREHQLALRPWDWPLSAEDPFDADGDRQVGDAIVAILTEVLGGPAVKRGVGNDWLKQTYHHYALDW